MKKISKYIFYSAVLLLITSCGQSLSEKKLNPDFLEDENEISISDFKNLKDISEILNPDEIVKADNDVSSINVNYYNPEDFDLSGFIADGEGYRGFHCS